MSFPSRVLDLIAQWESAREAGRSVTVADVCRDAPDLQTAVEDGIRRLYGSPSTVKSDAAPVPSAAGTPTLAGYEIEAELGRGGMGVVYKARHIKLNRPAAVKMVLGGDRVARVHLLRFLAEAEAVAAVDHPHVVRVYDYGEVDGRPFLAFEYCPGGTLSARIKAAGRLPPREAAVLVRTLAGAVHAAHLQGILHRDLKPANVLFDADGRPKVADFGVAKRVGAEEVTPAGHPIGTLAYMAPEQARADNRFIGPGVDVWALGVILFECLSGVRPFRATNDIDLLKQIDAGTPFSLKAVGDVPRDLDLICRKCLEKGPYRRYPSAAALADDLGRFLAGEPITARPVSTAVRTVKWVRRNPVPTALIASLALLAVATSVGAYYTRKAANEHASRIQAEQEKKGEQLARQQEAVQASVRLALQRGGAKEAAAAFEAAVASGLSVTPDVRLDYARALFILGRTDDALRALGEIDRSTLPESLRGPADLLEGAARLGGFAGDDGPALALIDRALGQPLPAADRHYAEGLIATATPDALDAFAAAVRADPTHVDARAMLVLTLICLGRTDDAIRLGEQSRPLAPTHPYFTTLLAFAGTMAGDAPAAVAHLDQLRPVFTDPAHFAAVREVTSFLAEARAAALKPNAAGGVDFALVNRFFALRGKIGLALAGFRTGDKLNPTLIPTRIPPFLRNGLKFLTDELVTAWSARGGGTVVAMGLFRDQFPGFKPGASAFRFNDEAGDKAAQAKLATHPEGTLKGLYAERLYELAEEEFKRAGVTDRYRERMARAGAALADAARTPGLFSFPVADLDNAFVAYWNAGAASPDDPPEADRRPERREWIATAFGLVRERVRRFGPFRDPDRFKVAVGIAVAAEAYSHARLWLDDWAKNATTPAAYYKLRAVVEYRIGAYEAAAAAIERLSPEQVTGDPEIVMISAECQKRIRRTEPAPPPRKKD